MSLFDRFRKKKKDSEFDKLLIKWNGLSDQSQQESAICNDDALESLRYLAKRFQGAAAISNKSKIPFKNGGIMSEKKSDSVPEPERVLNPNTEIKRSLEKGPIVSISPEVQESITAMSKKLSDAIDKKVMEKTMAEIDAFARVRVPPESEPEKEKDSVPLDQIDATLYRDIDSGELKVRYRDGYTVTVPGPKEGSFRIDIPPRYPEPEQKTVPEMVEDNLKKEDKMIWGADHGTPFGHGPVNHDEQLRLTYQESEPGLIQPLNEFMYGPAYNYIERTIYRLLKSDIDPILKAIDEQILNGYDSLEYHYQQYDIDHQRSDGCVRTFLNQNIIRYLKGLGFKVNDNYGTVYIQFHDTP